MYSAVWRHLPGPAPIKFVQALLLLAAVVALLFLWVFPWLAPRLPFNDVTVSAVVTLPTTSAVGNL